MSQRPIVFAALLTLPLVFPAGAGAERGLAFSNIRAEAGWIEIDIDFRGGLPARIAETLGRGVPATVTYEIELWRERATWFDHLATSRFLVYRIEYDAWEGVYRVAAPGGGVEKLADLDDLRKAAFAPRRIRVAPLARLDGREAHYFHVRAEVKPLELREIREIEEWLEGKIPGDEPRGEREGILGMPERLFRFVASVAGLGGEKSDARSITFRPASLE